MSYFYLSHCLSNLHFLFQARIHASDVTTAGTASSRLQSSPSEPLLWPRQPPRIPSSRRSSTFPVWGRWTRLRLRSNWGHGEGRIQICEPKNWLNPFKTVLCRLIRSSRNRMLNKSTKKNRHISSNLGYFWILKISKITFLKFLTSKWHQNYV